LFFGFELVYVMRSRPDRGWQAEQALDGSHKYDFFLPIVSNGGHIVLNVGIAVEKLVSPAPDEGSGNQKDDHGESESDTQRGNALLFNQRYHRRIVRFHARVVPTRSIGAKTRP
jgi:hypothetical protein